MMDDIELLRLYAEHRDERAFAMLVTRHISFVYSAALRQLSGASHRAEDVAQTVFIQLARNGPAASKRDNLVGWLYTATHYAAANLKRTESRRQMREEEASTLQYSASDLTEEASWAQLCLVLDAAMLELNERDRRAILLRFFQNERFAELGRKLGLTEDAARMRVERALEKLRLLLARRGITSTSAALAAAFADHSTIAAPVGLAAVVTGAALAGASSGTAIAAAGIFMSTKSIVAVAVVAAIGIAAYKFEVVSRLNSRAATAEVAGGATDLPPSAQDPNVEGTTSAPSSNSSPSATPPPAPALAALSSPLSREGDDNAALARKIPPQIVLSEVLGPNNSYHDAIFGISVTFPEKWEVSRAERWGDGSRHNTVLFTPETGPGIASNMYYKRFQPDEAALRDQSVEAYLRHVAAKKEAQRVVSDPDYRNVPESFEFTQINGASAMTYFATFTSGDKIMTEYFIRILGPKGYALFFTTGQLEEVQPIMPQLQRMAKSTRLP